MGPVFIVGAPRSGTTLLQYMLQTHPGLSLPTGESHFFMPLIRREAEFGDLSQPQNVRRVLDAMYQQSAEFLETDLHGLRFDRDALTAAFVAEGRHTMRDLISGLFEKNAAGEGKPRWGDKTPYYVLHMQSLRVWWPQAQFVHIVRDGRDVALSLFGRRHDFGVYNTYFAARYWEQYVETGHRQGMAMPAGHYLEIRYEDLLADPRATLARVCDFLRLDFVESLLQHRKPSTAGKTPLLGQPVQRDNAQKWRRAMSRRQIGVFESAVGLTLQHFGYALATPARPLLRPTRALHRLHNMALARWHGMRQGQRT